MKESVLCFMAAIAFSIGLQAQNTPVSQMEPLDRGVIVMPGKPSGQFISWRMLGTDDENATRFDILRNGNPVVGAKDLYSTNYRDAYGSATSEYQIVTKVNGQPVDTSAVAVSWGQDYLTIPLERPVAGPLGGTYTPNDCSVGDVDGDGEYEIFLKWDPSNSNDNSIHGKTDPVIIDCYKLDGTHLWRVNLGCNIRAGAHYTQFMVYDFDGDGRAEMICKTAPGATDGDGQYVNQAATDATIKGHSNTTDYRNSNGHVLQGAEYLTVFDGMTGRALHTTWYLAGRAGTGGADSENGSELGKVSAYPSSSGFWGDSYGGRSERYLAAVAYVNGADKPACAIFSRGYYTRAYVWAVSFDGTRLHTEWLHASPSKTQSVVFGKYDSSLSMAAIVVDGDSLQRKGLKTAPKITPEFTLVSDGGIVGSQTMYGNGNHNLSIADVDGDGCDEILWGSAALNNDGTMLYATGYGHGDAIHLSDLLPDRPGLELFQVHEEKLKGGLGSWDLHDACTGKIIYYGGSDGVDNGRGLAADITLQYRGFEFWSSDDRTPRRADTGNSTSLGSPSVNFRIYWNGDLQDELLDGHYAKNSKDEFDHVDHIYITEGANSSRIVDLTNRSLCNTTKMTPNLQADILGDWREELVLWDYQDPTKLYIHATNTETGYRMPTLMHDHTYRMGVAWQNTAYNQPPHLGYYLPDAMMPRLLSDEREFNATVGQPFELQYNTLYVKSGLLSGRTGPDGKLSTEFKGSFSTADKTFTITGTPTKEGDYRLITRLTGYGNESVIDTMFVHVTQTDGITDVTRRPDGTVTEVYDLSGRRIQSGADRRHTRGMRIVRRRTADGFVTEKVF